MISLADRDAVEIRVPFDDMLNRSFYRRDNLARADLDSGKVLNVRINANFRDDDKKDDPVRRDNIKCNNVSDLRGKNFRTAVYSMNNTNPTKNSDIQTQESCPSIDGKSKNISKGDNKEDISSNPDLKTLPSISDNVDLKPQATSDNVDLKTQQAIAKDLSASESINLSLFKETAAAEPSNTNKITNTAPSEATANDKTESSDSQPSKAIPWWSSSDTFSKVRKIDDDLAKPIAPMLNQSKEKDISNLDQSLVIEPLAPKSKEILPKMQTKNEDSTYNASINNSNNLISYETPKAFDRYSSSSFRLKPNPRNTSATPEMIRPHLETENDQIAHAREDNKNISDTRQLDSHMPSTLGTMNKQDKQDVSIEKKISLSSKDGKMTSGQNLLLKDQKQHSREQIDLIDDESNMKSKIESIIDSVKLIEKREDDTLTDYGLNVSPRKAIITLNRQKEENPNPEIKNRKDLMTDKYDQVRENVTKHDCINAMKTKSERQEIDKIISADQIKMDEKKRIETLSDTLERKEDSIVKNIAITDKEQNKIYMKDDNDAMTLSYLDVKDSSKLTTNEHEKSVKNIVPDNSVQTSELPKYDKHDHPNVPKSLESIPISKQLKTSAKILSDELKQNEREYLSCINNIPESKIEESKKLNNLSNSKNAHYLSEEFFNSIAVEIPITSNGDANKVANKDEPSAVQTQANPTSKNSLSKEAVPNESINKDAAAMPINNKNNDIIKDTVTKAETPKIGNSDLPKNSEADHSQELKPASNEKNVSFDKANGDNAAKNAADDSKSTHTRMPPMVMFIFT